jgi:HSP20 family protein
MLTLRGRRVSPHLPDARPLALECAWGSCSRSIILPAEVDPDGVTAAVESGVLTVRLPKADQGRRIDVR